MGVVRRRVRKRGRRGVGGCCWVGKGFERGVD